VGSLILETMLGHFWPMHCHEDLKENKADALCVRCLTRVLHKKNEVGMAPLVSKIQAARMCLSWLRARALDPEPKKTRKTDSFMSVRFPLWGHQGAPSSSFCKALFQPGFLVDACVAGSLRVVKWVFENLRDDHKCYLLYGVEPNDSASKNGVAVSKRILAAMNENF
jgi:hypothetical protein